MYTTKVRHHTHLALCTCCVWFPQTLSWCICIEGLSPIPTACLRAPSVSTLTMTRNNWRCFLFEQVVWSVSFRQYPPRRSRVVLRHFVVNILSQILKIVERTLLPLSVPLFSESRRVGGHARGRFPLFFQRQYYCSLTAQGSQENVFWEFSPRNMRFQKSCLSLRIKIEIWPKLGYLNRMPLKVYKRTKEDLEEKWVILEIVCNVCTQKINDVKDVY